MAFSVGLGLTNECNLRCAHCHFPNGVYEVAVDTPGSLDVVLGPSEDGGYYLIGLRTVRRELFAARPWSTSQVLQETIQRAHAKGFRVACRPPWYDIDTPDDLARLPAAPAASDGEVPQHTRGFLNWSGRDEKPLGDSMENSVHEAHLPQSLALP